MIVDKNKPIDQGGSTEDPEISVTVTDNREMTVAEAVAGNALEDVFLAVSKIIKEIKLDPDDPNSPPLFKTVKWNTGQLNRVRNSKQNSEYALAFPACFLHFINVYWNLGFNRVNQAYADLRICYVLNRLNNNDDEFQTEGARVFKQILEAINDNMSSLTPLVTRFQLSYWDQVESFEKGLQQYWITYQVRFNDYTSYRYKTYKPVYLAAPPFTNFSDMDEEKNTDNKPDVIRPIEDAAYIVYTVPPKKDSEAKS